MCWTLLNEGISEKVCLPIWQICLFLPEQITEMIETASHFWEGKCKLCWVSVTKGMQMNVQCPHLQKLQNVRPSEVNFCNNVENLKCCLSHWHFPKSLQKKPQDPGVEMLDLLSKANSSPSQIQLHGWVTQLSKPHLESGNNGRICPRALRWVLCELKYCGVLAAVPGIQ